MTDETLPVDPALTPPLDPIQVVEAAQGTPTPTPGSENAADLNATSTGTVEPGNNDPEKSPDPAGTVQTVQDPNDPAAQPPNPSDLHMNVPEGADVGDEDTAAAPEIQSTHHGRHGVLTGPEHTRHSQHSAHHKGIA